MERKIRWGLMGAGAILDRWMLGALQHDDMEIVAIASRTPESAKKMAEKYNIPEVVTYDELVAREDIDVVYIPVIHPAHKELSIKAMNAGKAVLVEKPAAVNAGDFSDMIECAKKNNVFLMEADWTRFFPLYEDIKQVINSGEIGKVRILQSSFCFSQEEEKADGRLLDPNKAGGSMLDVGVYNLQFANIILGKYPEKLVGLASIDSDDNHFMVDESAAYVASYDEGELAVLTSSVRTHIPENAYIYGSKGHIEIYDFYKPSKAKIVVGNTERIIENPISQKIQGIVDEGYQYEIAHVNECIRKELKESDIAPMELTLEILKECDSLRKQWGLIYPFEKSI